MTTLKPLKNITYAIAALFIVNFALGLFLARTAVAGGGGATGGATEFTQLINKAQLVSQSARQELQLLHQVEQTYLSKLQQLRGDLGEYTTTYQAMLKTYQNVADVSNKLTHFGGSLDRMKGALDDRYRQFSASKLSPTDWLAREHQLIADGDQRARALMVTNREILLETQSSMRNYQQSAQKMNSTTGTHSATQILGAQLAMLGGDINKLVAITALQNEVRAAEAQEGAAVRQRQLDTAEKIRAAQAELNERRRKELDALNRIEIK